VNVTVSTVETVNSPECIDCSECVNVCPVKDTLTVAGPMNKSGRRMRLSTMAVLGSVIGIIAVGLALTTATGTFAWTTPSLGAVAPGTTATPSSFDFESIKGSMSFEEISKATGIPADAFMQKFGVTEAEMNKPMKEFAEAKGFEVKTDVREWVKQQLEAAGAE
jgi:ferredoxin